ncbi:MAG: NAD(P)/FAD-dependent oxidoreductase [Pseudomonadota bacterium]
MRADLIFPGLRDSIAAAQAQKQTHTTGLEMLDHAMPSASTSEVAAVYNDVDFDCLVVGAGFGGLYALHRLRGAGFRTRVIEAGSDVGGTWYWNRYPGCRCDIESMQYSYAFSDELQNAWNWSERYAPQSEILSYAQHVADRFDLRRDIQFDTRVTAATYDEEAKAWRLTTDDGGPVSCRFLISAVGCLSAANTPVFEGRETFDGPIYHTGHWPHEGVDFTGKRVAVIGTGSSGIQSIPIIARQAKALTIFQRTPNFVAPARNRKLTDAERAAVKKNYKALRARARQRPTGFYFDHNNFSAQDVTDDEREAILEQFWQNGGLTFLGAFNDLLLDRNSNQFVVAFIHKKIREIVKDPATADLLCPDDIAGCKRLCADTGYYETYNQPHVTLCDISKTPITRLTPRGIAVGDREYPVDAIVCATGFDAMTGGLIKMNVKGAGGLTLADKWHEGPRSYMGLAIAGFPNLFTITGPGSPSVFANMIMCIEQHADWITSCVSYMRAGEKREISAQKQAEDAWVAHNQEVGQKSLRSQCNSWYLGANVPGKPRVFSPYIGGLPAYTAKLKDVVAGDYDGFDLAD